MQNQIKLFLIIAVIILSSNFLLAQTDLGLHPLKMDKKEKLSAQLKAIEAAIHFENTLLLNGLFREYFDQKNISFENRKDLIENDFFNVLKIKQKNGYIRSYTKNIVLEIIDFKKDHIIVKTKFIGYEKAPSQKHISYIYNKKNYPIFSYEELKSLLTEMGGKL